MIDKWIRVPLIRFLRNTRVMEKLEQYQIMRKSALMQGRGGATTTAGARLPSSPVPLQEVDKIGKHY